jgi:hypothetical protein
MNYLMGDRMLCYKQIGQYFFMDTLFAMSKAGKPTRGNSCCQLFVTDKGFVYMVPMKKESEVLQAVKQFVKAIGAPEAIIWDEIGTTLRVLEENTPLTNMAELYIGLLKETVQKDMKESDCPLALWDYCTGRRARIDNLTARNLFSHDGNMPHQDMTGKEGDISNLCQYG